MDTITGKFRIDSFTKFQWGNTIEIKMNAVTGGTPENDAYHNSTPSGEIRLMVSNPTAATEFMDNLGKEIYVEFKIRRA